MHLPDDLKATVLSDLARTPAPTRREFRHANLVVLALCAVLAVVGAVMMNRLVGARVMNVRADLYVAVATTAFTLLAVLATLLAVSRRTMVGPPRVVTLLMSLGAPLLLLSVLLALNVAYPDNELTCVNAAGMPRAGFVCMDVSLLLGVFPVLALLSARRGGLSVRPFQAGVGMGLAVGAWTGVGITLSCECTNSSHVLLGHVLPMLLLALFGGVAAFFAARRQLRRPSR